VHLPSALIGFAEIVADRWLYASGTSPLPEELTGKQLRIELESGSSQTAATLLLSLDRNGVRLLQEDDPTTTETVNATVSGTPSALLALLVDKGGASADQPRISGDLQLVRKLTAHLHQGHFTLETLLTDWTGPQTAYRLSQWAGQTMDWLASSSEKLSANLADYLQYETDTLINPLEWQTLTDEITELERRIGAMQRRLTALGKSPS